VLGRSRPSTAPAPVAPVGGARWAPSGGTNARSAALRSVESGTRSQVETACFGGPRSNPSGIRLIDLNGLDMVRAPTHSGFVLLLRPNDQHCSEWAVAARRRSRSDVRAA
jgi:hypothetical protein